MTFNYNLLLKRILHCNNIINTVREKENLQKEIKNFSFTKEEIDSIFTFLKNNINIFNVNYLQESENKHITENKVTDDDIKTINNRTKIININI